LNRLVKHDLVKGLKDVVFEKDKLCSSYQADKQVENTHPKKSMMSTSKAFELLHMNLFGPCNTLGVRQCINIPNHEHYHQIHFIIACKESAK
jgi:hypothetical protein